MKYGLNIPAPQGDKLDRIPVLMSDVYRRQLMHPINGYIANLIQHMKALPALVSATPAQRSRVHQMPITLAQQGHDQPSSRPRTDEPAVEGQLSTADGHVVGSIAEQQTDHMQANQPTEPTATRGVPVIDGGPRALSTTAPAMSPATALTAQAQLAD